MKRTSDSNWAHILCALLLPGVLFKDPINKDPINALTITNGYVQQYCSRCQQSRGACVSCDECNSLFHPTCGIITGAQLQIDSNDKIKVKTIIYFYF